MALGQEALWFLSKLAPDSRAYHLCGAARLVEPLAPGLPESLRHAFSELSARHPALRTTFGEGEDGRPEQRIGEAPGIPFRFEVAAGTTESEALLAAHLDLPFDLGRGPLARAGLIANGDEAVLWLAAHHLVADFWSLAVMLRDLGEVLAAQRADLAPGDPAPEREAEGTPGKRGGGGPQLTYAQWALWQRDRAEREEGRRELEAWRRLLAGELPPLELPTDRPRRPRETWAGGAVDISLSEKATRALAQIARGGKTNLFAAIVTAFQAFLGRLSGQDELIVGTPTSGRFGARVADQVGYFVNPVPIRADLSGDPSIQGLLARQRSVVQAALALQAFPFSRLAEEIQAERQTGRAPLFDVMLAYEKARGGEGFWGFALGLPGMRVDLGGLALESLRVEPSGSPFDLSLAVAEVGGGLAGSLRYSEELFDRSTIERWSRWLMRWLEWIAAAPARRLSEVPYFSAEESAELWADRGREEGPEPRERRIHDFVETWARERPAAPALESEHEPGRRYTWADLDAHTDRLARRLAGLGVGPEKVVGVSIERSVDRVLAMVAIWKAGGCYLPIDPELPVERRRLMVVDSGTVALVGRSAYWEDLTSGWEGWHGRVAPLLLRKESGLPETEDFGPEELPRSAVAENLAYLIYTSGSTGTPKGVGISHRHAVGHFAAASRFYRMDGTDRVVQFASASFDVSMEQVGVALASGGELVVRGPELPNPLELSAWMTRWGITNANLPTAVWTEWSRAEDPLPEGLRVLVTGGEAMTPAAAERFRKRMAMRPTSPVVFNGYGPTETVVTATCFDLRGEISDGSAVSIGMLLPRRHGAVVDRRGHLLPLGIPGELALGGLLARGYLDRPDLTAERFRPDFLAGAPVGGRLYHTGDRVRLRLDGTLDYLGRIDQQIKIRGIRIEPGEIEAAIETHPAIREAIVFARESSLGLRLIAWVRRVEGATEDEAAPAVLRAFLKDRLPEAMVPVAFVAVEEWPIGASGKVDRRALPEPSFASGEAERIAPRTPLEVEIERLFAELLGCAEVGAEEDFFALGGHSLLVTQLVSRIRRGFGVELGLAELFAGATVAGIAARVASEKEKRKLIEGSEVQAIERVARGSDDVPLSFAQERLWFVDRLEPGRATYNVGFRLVLGGELRVPALEAALATVVARHEPLRTRYAQPGDVARQEVDPPSVSFSRWPLVDLAAVLDAGRPVEAARIGRNEGRRPFDLARGPVWRAVLARRGPALHDAIFTFHHIAIDGWSLAVFSREIAEVYSSFVEKRPARLPELPITYADWAIWQRRHLSGERYERELSWRRSHLKGAPEATELPVDRPRPAVPKRNAAQVRRTLPSQLAKSIATRANAEASTPFMMLFAAWAGLLSRLGSGTDLVIGTPIANRNRAETEGLIGFFVNSLAIRVTADPSAPLRSLVSSVREASVGAFAHQDFPFERLVAELGVTRGGNVPPIYQVSFAFQNLPVPVMLPGLTTTVEELDGGAAKLDLGLVVTPVEDRLEAQLEVNLDLFDPATGARLLAGFERMAWELTEAPERLLAEAELLGRAERHQLLYEWNEGGGQLPGRVIHDFVRRWARERPDALALESEHEPGRLYSWAELDTHTERMARRLVGLGVGPERVVGVSIERSVDRVLGMVAIWKAGGCYLPIDPELPVERRRLLVVDSGAVAVVGRSAYWEDLTSGWDGWHGRVAPLLVSKEGGLPEGEDFGAEERARWAVAENLAYLIYTSGSTGTPKGVGISHRHAVGHFVAASGFYRMDGSDRVVQFASASFDVSMEQVGVALASGGALVVRGPEMPNPLELSAWMTRWGITNANLPTAVWTEWSQAEDPLPEGLRVLVTGGEAMTPAAAERFRKRMAMRPTSPVVYNGYGPTETVVTATCYDLRFGRLSESGSVSIGRLLPSRTGYVVDGEDRLVPLGGIGELVLGGLLARGYLDRPDLTAERFRPNPFTDKDGERLYRTGDRVRQRGDGSFDYLGRLDQQIKIRGFRIEPGEIEAALEAYPHIKEAIVLARDSAATGKRLIAWVRRAGDGANPHATSDSLSSELSSFLKGRLPDYMVPMAIVEVDEWPLSPSGKIDRRALPDPAFQETFEKIAPRTPTEEIVAGMFGELLGASDVGAEADFFALGGHSLLATQLASRIRKTFGVELPLAELFSGSTVAQIAERIEAASGAAPAPAIVRAADAEREGVLSFAEERLWFLDRLAPGRSTYNVGFRLSLRGPLVPSALRSALAGVVSRHAPLRSRFGEREGIPFTTIGPAEAMDGFRLPKIDLSVLGSKRKREGARVAAAEGRRSFDLSRGPVVRATLVRIDTERHDLLVVFHHIATDGWSLSVFSREVAELYAAAVEGRLAVLPPLSIEYADWAVWQRAWLSGKKYAGELSWWRSRLEGMPETIDLPSDRPRPRGEAMHAAEWVRRDLGSDLAARIGARARASGSTPFMVLLAAWAGLLSRLGAGGDVPVGAPIANRNRSEIEGLIGFFVNSLVMRVRAEAGATLGILLENARETALAAYAHQDFPFDRLVGDRAGARGGGAPPMFQTSLVFQNLPETAELPGLLATIEPLDGGVAKLDLSLVITPRRAEDGSGLSALLEIDLDVFDPATGARLLAGFERLSEQMANQPDRLLAEAELLALEERHQLLVEWNDGAAGFRAPVLCIHDFVRKWARERPDGLALESVHEPGRRYTWAELEAHTERLSRRLTALGVGPEGVVAVSLPWSVDRLLAMVAIWKAGGCYLPVDPELPVERRRLLLMDSAAVAFVGRTAFWNELMEEWEPRGAGFAPLLLDEASGLPLESGPEGNSREAAPQGLAYLIYTSGSTGTPKGVAVSHEDAVGHFASAAAFYRMDASERVIQFASASFDVSMEQVGTALACGGTLVVRGPELPPPLDLTDWLERHRITHANLPTAVWAEWSRADGPLPRDLRVLVTAGEVMSPQAAERFLVRAAESDVPPRILNGYGPTEAVVIATCHDIAQGRLPESGSVSIGRSLPGRSALVIDGSGTIQPLGGRGELALGGFLARGYLGRPDLTAERFRPDPFGADRGSPGARLYWTGDRVRIAGSGAIDFFGRIDQQVKIRGFRIEPGEIESALADAPGVGEAIVLARAGATGEARLLAWYRPASSKEVPVDPTELRRFLAARLPDYMVPAAFVAVEGWPKSPSGKIDKRALPEPEVEAARYVAPRTPIERGLAEAFSEMLGVVEVGADDDFFALGGHSLLATRLVSRIRREFGVELGLAELFAGATVSGIAARVAAEREKQKLIEGSEVGAIERRGGGSDVVPLSFAQERLWFIDRSEPGRATYNVGFRLVLGGELCVPALETALAALVARHEPLRTRYAQPGDVARQEIDPPSPRFSSLSRVDLEAISRVNRSFSVGAELASAREHRNPMAEASSAPTLGEFVSSIASVEAARIGRLLGRRPFDLGRGPVMRAILVRRGPALHDAIFTFHHIAIDGWSLAVFSREIAEAYSSFVDNRTARLIDLPISYADWAIWQRRQLSGERYERELVWWRTQLEGAPEAIELAVDRPRPSSPKRQAAQVCRSLPPQLATSIAARANAEASTPFMMLLAAWAGLLSRLGAGRDLVIGTPIANRNRAETEGLIGFFVNSLAIRVTADPTAPMRSLLSSVREASFGAFAHQDFPFERLVAELGVARGGNVPPIYQVSFAFQNLPAPVMLPGLTTTIEELDGGTAKLDLGLVVTPFEDRLEAQLEVNLDLFDPATGARLLAKFERMARELAEAPERPLAEAELLGPLERHQLLYEWNEGGAELPERILHAFLRRWARERPTASALESEHEPGRVYSWSELDAHTDRLARRLAGLGVGPEWVVGVSLERSVDRVLAMVAIWKAGGCYMPIDPELPVERRRLLVADSGAVAVVTRVAFWGDLTSDWEGWHGRVAPLLLGKEDGLPEGGYFGPEESPRSALAENLAYLIYTSGSTGMPKGVGVSHRAAAGHFAAAKAFYGLGDRDRIVQFAEASFDVSMEQVGLSLACGCALVVRGPALPLDLPAWLDRLAITDANLPTAVWSEWAHSDAPIPEALRVLVVGGEAMAPAAAVRFREKLAECGRPPRLLNAYGPTEAVVTATAFDLRQGPLPESGSISIGRLLPGRTGYVVDEEGRLAPLGGIGELVLGGLLARGYLDRPDLTAERFRPNPFAGEDGERLYRTGDRVRQRGEGSFDYLGRIDQQIKVRGFRIEPGEIEAALESHPQIQEAIVLARESVGVGKRLIAWLRRTLTAESSRDEKGWTADLRAYLMGRLPEYMVPSAFVAVERWPVSPSGKIDRRALPDPVFAEEARERTAPRTPTEEIVAGLFAELLGASDLGSEADFFALGGHSLLATRLVSRVRKIFEVELPLAELFSVSTVAGVASRIDSLRGSGSPSALQMAPPLLPPPRRPAEIPLSFAQERLWFLDRLEPGSATYNAGLRLRLGGEFDETALLEALRTLIARHEPLRTRIVESNGGPIQAIDPATEAARAFRWPRVDLAGISPKAEGEAARLARSEGRRPFDLARSSMLRAARVVLGTGRCDLLLVFHHIATDGWSLGIFSRELVELYTAWIEHRKPALAALPLGYADWSLWQRAWLSGAVYERELAWWRERLAGAPEALDLPFDHPRPAYPSRRGWSVEGKLAEELSGRLAACAGSVGATLSMVLLAAWCALLERFGAGLDQVLAMPIANRNRSETEGLVGFFVNTLALRIEIPRRNVALGDLISRVRDASLAAYAHQDFPFEKLAERGGTPPGQVSFAFQNLPEPVVLPGVEMTAEELSGEGAKFDLGLIVVPGRNSGDSMRTRIEISLDRFDPATGARLLAAFERMAVAVAGHPERALGDVEVFGPAERHQMLCEWNASGWERGWERAAFVEARVQDFVTRWARERPEALALKSEHEPARGVSWAALEEHTDALARRLAGLGVGPEKVVAVSLDWSVDRVLAMVAVWKAGGCYLPVDPVLPVERQRLLVVDSGAVVVVSRGAFLEGLTAGWEGWSGRVAPLLLSKESGLPEGVDFGAAVAPRKVVAENLAYLIYTSGSTGMPKGVGVAHGEAVRHFASSVERYGWSERDRVALLGAMSFDLSVDQVGCALAAGATLVVRGPEMPAPSEFSAWLERLQISCVTMPTPLFAEWTRSDRPLPEALRMFYAGGEAMPAEAASRLRERVERGSSLLALNAYGPTEAVVAATCHDVLRGALPEVGSVSIGRLLPGRVGFVVDEVGNPVPLGGTGELALGGPLARGYLDRPDLTAERFRPNPFTDKDGERLYRTGDRVRQRGDGTFDHLGRLDQQVKIRGFRIELGEIEAALAAHPQVIDSVVAVREAPKIGDRLVAWVRLREQVKGPDLRAHLARILPEYMVPAAFVEVEVWPLTPSGKIDRRALPDPVFDGEVGKSTAPRTPIEEILAGVFGELLGVGGVGVDGDFFALGGHSLLATRLVSRVREVFGIELPLAEVFARSTVEGVAAAVEEKLNEGKRAEPIARGASESDEVPLSFAQERLWFLDRLEPGSAAYNIGFRLTLEGALSVPALEAALSHVVARHEPLRTRYVQVGDVARQIVDPPSTSFSRFPCVDLQGISPIDSPMSAGSVVSDEAARIGGLLGRRPFDLARGPVVRVLLVRRGPALHDAIFSFHHIAIDGWSMSVFSREIAEAYTSFVEKRAAHLPGLPISYSDWTLWQRRQLSGERYERELAWWKARLAGAPEALELPTDRPRPSAPKRRAAIARCLLPPELARTIRTRANAEASTPFMMLLAAWAGLLSRLGSGRDLVIGTPIANRNRAETEGLIGFFVNSLALRITADPSAPLRSLLTHAREASIGAFAHQDFPFERLVAELGVARGGNVPPIYQVSFAFQNLPDVAPEAFNLPGLETTVAGLSGGAAKLDLALVVSPVQEGWLAELELNTDQFDPATGARLLAGFERMARVVAEAPEQRLAEAELLGRLERHQLLYEWNEGGEELPASVVHDFVRRWAREKPTALALESEHEPGRKYSWMELERHTDRLARRLAGLGVGPEKVVGVSIERSVDRVLAMIAIWKAGGCYLPIDPELPVERRRLLVVDSGAVAVVVRGAYWEDLTSGWEGWHGRVAPLLVSKESGLPEGEDFGAEESPRSAVAENLAYLIYTSGSTGTPKGVGVSHRHGVGHFAAASEFYRMDGTDRVVQFASASFDVSMEQVGVALASGGTLVVRGSELPNPLELSAWMTRWGITNANLPTAVWTEWSRAEDPLPEVLRVLVTGGEAMTPAAAERFRKRMAMRPGGPVVYNGYGPTETVVTATCYDLSVGRLAESGSVSIGRLLPSRTGYVVDEANRLAPLGGLGELVLGGLLARGYLDRPDLTAERFRPNPFTGKCGERLYRTGDRVRQRGDGSFDYLGRLDQQIKIRGFRIEPGEIEAALGAHPAVRDSIVLAREAPGVGKRLVAWVRWIDGLRPSLGSERFVELRRFVAGRLPDYMVPSAFAEVEEWPLGPTGKIDRRALPEPERLAAGPRTAPKSAIQCLIAELWRETLPEATSDLAIEDGFFDLGGHSLLAVGLLSKISATFRVELKLKSLFETPTIAGLEAAVLAAETRPGQSETIARVLLKVRGLSPDAKRELLASG